MSRKSDDSPVTEKLCESRRQTIQEQINGLKRTIYVSSLAVITVVTIVQFVLTLVLR